MLSTTHHLLLSSLTLGFLSIAQSEASALLELESEVAWDAQCGSWRGREGWTCAQLAPNFALYWLVSVGAETIAFSLDIKPTPDLVGGLQWVGLGLSEGGGMPGSDIFALQRNQSDSSWMLTDMYATAFRTPMPDGSQDLKLVNYAESSTGGLRATFFRPLAACKANDLPVLPGIRLPMIFAFGDDWYSGHSNLGRGSALLQLWHLPSSTDGTSSDDVAAASKAPPSGGGRKLHDGLATSSETLLGVARRRLRERKKKRKRAAMSLSPPPSPPLSSSALDVRYFDIVMPDTPVPENTEDYRCLDVELPSDAAYHIIGWDGITNQSGSPTDFMHTHHMQLFTCPNNPSSFGQGTYPCWGVPSQCTEHIMLWAAGEGRIMFPPEAGMPMGQGGVLYVTLQVHYRNPDNHVGVKDSSGFKIEYTPHLRKHDIGVLITGTFQFTIPPKVEDWRLGPNTCSSEATKTFISNITIFKVALHMHARGVKMIHQHFRGSEELRPFGVRNYYDDRWQPALEPALDTQVVMPGDALVTTCIYSNPGDSAVGSGSRSTDEMCLAYSWYYPRSAANLIDYCVQQGRSTTNVHQIGGDWRSFGQAAAEVKPFEPFSIRQCPRRRWDALYHFKEYFAC